MLNAKKVKKDVSKKVDNVVDKTKGSEVVDRLSKIVEGIDNVNVKKTIPTKKIEKKNDSCKSSLIEHAVLIVLSPILILFGSIAALFIISAITQMTENKNK